MIDRKARDKIAEVLRSFMNDEATAFELDEALSDASDATEDKTAQAVARELWLHYDDLNDHKIFASRDEWKYLNRLLLLLESEGEMETVGLRTRWHATQGAAALLLAAGLLSLYYGGLGHLIVCILLFGPASMLVAFVNDRRRKNQAKAQAAAIMPATTPFPSVSSLLTVRRRVSGFVRQRYPEALANRRNRASNINKLNWVLTCIGWCIFSPFVLCFQLLPERESEIRIRLPK